MARRISGETRQCGVSLNECAVEWGSYYPSYPHMQIFTQSYSHALSSKLYCRLMRPFTIWPPSCVKLSFPGPRGRPGNEASYLSQDTIFWAKIHDCIWTWGATDIAKWIISVVCALSSPNPDVFCKLMILPQPVASILLYRCRLLQLLLFECMHIGYGHLEGVCFIVELLEEWFVPKLTSSLMKAMTAGS